MKGLAPPRPPDSESGPSAIRVKPHAHLEMVLPAGLSPATWRFEAARSDGLSYGSMNWGRRGDSHSRGANRPAVYETAAVAAEPRRHEMACQAVALTKANRNWGDQPDSHRHKRLHGA